MFEPVPEPTGAGGVIKLIGGLFLGVVAGILIPVVVFMMVASGGGSGGVARLWVAEILDLGILAVIGYLTYREIAHSMLARGFMIGISIAFLMNAICGFVLLRLR
jgi:hypothetical protein